MSLVHDHEQTMPKGALASALVLVGTAIALTALVKVGVLSREAIPAAARTEAHVAPAVVRQLTFTDRGDGAVVVRDVSTGETVRVLVDGVPGNGFVRGVMRGMARERHIRGVGMAPPFTLTLWKNGTLSLDDKATGRSIELGSFGPDNRAAFAALLPGGAA
ncbi:photosynthetic complex assembly protein PuhC [Novosphingobium sp.]|uniref:photosynthetic complex assembly protein PuhC n=1 Tax=Novosphingobium sp. TaxID=1874826 RepID=UPI0026301C4B|nr:photosynthetic complex assembly protein PuhC [Novosphingobium sp.]